MPLTKSQINKLGKRIGSGQGPLDEDTFRKLQEFRLCYTHPLEEVQRRIEARTYLPCTSRLKTLNTIVEKLRRHQPRLTTMQDIAGARAVVPASLV